MNVYIPLDIINLISSKFLMKGTGENFKGDHLQAYIEGQLVLDFKVV